MGAAERLHKNYYTFEEYLALEAIAEFKSEYHNGQIYAMSGGTLRHGLIGNSMGAALLAALRAKGSKCLVPNSEVKVYIEAANKSVYPDTMAICEKPIFWKNKKTVITNPRLIVEVLSDSTESYDRTHKFKLYQQLPSFKEYILISQKQPIVEGFCRESNGLWRISSAAGLDQSIHLYSLDTDIPLADIYAQIDFPEGIQSLLDFDLVD